MLDKKNVTAVFSAQKIYGPEYNSETGQKYQEVVNKYQEIRDELSIVLAQLAVTNTKFLHESKRSSDIQNELNELRIEYLEHLRETSKSLMKIDVNLKVVMFLDVSGFSLLDKVRREGLLDMLRSMVPTLLNSREASEINMWGDAIVATFSDPNHAIESAMRFVRHLEVDRMSVRIGMAWGEVRTNFNPATGRRDIDGEVVNRAARMEPLAPTGGILASEEFGGLEIDQTLAELVPVEVSAKKSFADVKAGDMIKAFRIRILKN
ncbi:adenylate/guanylate cyclase domain-containing protein [Sphingomonas sp. Sphisp140]|uniref:adenylate/guanylate cyclase domain-containing protein n=1 Tax=unclassified Sphingomonas TaxID=196159 RepID=UPI0039B09960